MCRSVVLHIDVFHESEEPREKRTAIPLSFRFFFFDVALQKEMYARGVYVCRRRLEVLRASTATSALLSLSLSPFIGLIHFAKVLRGSTR